MGAAVIGMGWAAGEHFKAYQNNPHTRVRAVCSRTPGGAQAKLDALAADSDTEGVRVCASVAEVLADPEIKIVSLCSPPSLHVEQAIQAARAGKHIVLEKPVALTLPDLRRLQKEVAAAGVSVAVCLECHYNPQVLTLRSLLDQGLIGPVYYLESDYYHGIGPWYKQWEWNVTVEEGASSLLSAGIHALDLVMWFADSEVEEVFSYGCLSPNNPLQYCYPPTAVTLLRFATGTMGKCASDLQYRGPYYFPFEIHGEQGTIRDNQFFSTKLSGQKGFATVPTILLDSGDVTHHPYQDEIDEFVECLREKRPFPLDLSYAARVHEVVFAADLSAREGRPVPLAEIRGK
jgi:predicted dehydrogenase